MSLVTNGNEVSLYVQPKEALRSAQGDKIGSTEYNHLLVCNFHTPSDTNKKSGML